MKDKLFNISVYITFVLLVIFLLICIKVQTGHINELSKSLEKIKADVVGLKAEMEKLR